jgi:uncharacterized protein YjbI with pentapeptide repeats
MDEHDATNSAASPAASVADVAPRRRRPRLKTRPAPAPTTMLPTEGRHLGQRLTRAEVEQLVAEAGTSAGLDLVGADLRGADLSGLSLAGADLRAAMVQGAGLARANLTRARLDEANLEAADLRGALLTGARLDRAQMSGAHLDGAALQGAHLAGAHLAHASLEGARLGGAFLDGATLWGVRLGGAELDGTHFGGADLHDANLHGAFLAGCALADADLALVRWDGLRAGEELAAARAPLAERAEAYLGAADAYRRLRQACTAQGLYDRAGEAYRREMRMRRKANGAAALVALWRMPLVRLVAHALFIVLLALAVPLIWLVRGLGRLLRPLAPLGAGARKGGRGVRAAWQGLWRPAVRWVWHVALELLCGYGERVGRVLVAAAVVIVGMAAVYLRLGQLTEANGHAVTSFWHALYFSVCSFTSIGYAAFAPNAAGLSKWLGVAEAFTGNFLLALFLVTFTRKLTR